MIKNIDQLCKVFKKDSILNVVGITLSSETLESLKTQIKVKTDEIWNPIAITGVPFFIKENQKGFRVWYDRELLQEYLRND